MTSQQFTDHYDMQQLRELFAGKRLNASQAARVAGVKRPVIATWASRHKDKGFPKALPQDAGSRETLHDALEFVQWASSRRLTFTVDEMLVSAAIEASSGLEVENFQDFMQSLLTLVLAYGVVDPVAGERPTSLLRRYAQASPSTVQNITPLVLKVSAADIERLTCLAFALARFSADILGDAQRFAAVVLSRRGDSEQLSLDLCSLVKDAGDKFLSKVRLHLAQGADVAAAVQVAQSLLLNRDRQRELTITAKGRQSSSFARALALVANEELLALPEEEAENPSAIFFLLPLSKAALNEQRHWEELEALLLDAPVGVPVVVLGRAEVLGAEFTPAKNPARTAVLGGGHLLALLEVGTRQLVTESGARLMVAVFENRPVTPRQPLIALTSLSQRLDAAHRTDREVTLDDIESVIFESRQAEIHSTIGEHRLHRVVRVHWKDLQENGFDALLASESRRVRDDEAKQRIERNVRVLADADYQPLSLRWSVEPLTGITTQSLKSARDDGKLRRLPGVSALKLEEIVEFSAANDRVRVIDAGSMEHLRSRGALPDVFASVSTFDLLVEKNLEMAQVGDLLVLEGARPVVLPVWADAGLMVAQAPVFILRRNATHLGAPEFRLEAFAGLVQAALDAQIEDGAARASWGKACVAVNMLDAVLSDAANVQVDALDEQLRKLRLQEEALQEQLKALQAVGVDTLRGLAGGFLTFNGE